MNNRGRALRNIAGAVGVGAVMGIIQHLGGDPGSPDMVQEATRAANPDMLKTIGENVKNTALAVGGYEAGKAVQRHRALGRQWDK